MRVLSRPREAHRTPLASERYRTIARGYLEPARELVDRLPDLGIFAEDPRDRVAKFLGDA